MEYCGAVVSWWRYGVCIWGICVPQKCDVIGVRVRVWNESKLLNK